MEKLPTHELRLPPGEREDHRMICWAMFGEVPCGRPASDPVHTVIRKVSGVKPATALRGTARPAKFG